MSIQTGHFVTIENIKTGSKGLFFLYISGNEDPDLYKKVILGIRSLRYPDIKIRADLVADFAHLKEEYPEIENSVIHKLPVHAFFDPLKKTFWKELFMVCLRNLADNKIVPFPSIVLGGVAADSDFFDREKLIKEIWKEINRGNNILLCGPRRYGKTSIMKHVESHAILYKFDTIHIDLEAVSSIEEFIAQLCANIQYPDFIIQKKQEIIESYMDDLEGQWEKKGEALLAQALKKTKKKLVLLDECPYMLDHFLGKEKPEDANRDLDKKISVNAFNQWFHNIRTKFKDKWVFVISGSIDINTYLKENNLNYDHFSDFKMERITYFNLQQTRLFIQSLLLKEEIVLSNELLHEISKLATPGIPYFIQVFVREIISYYRSNPQITIKDIKNKIYERLIGFENRRMFDTFERHFSRYGKRKQGAVEILRELSKAGEKGLRKNVLKTIYYKAIFPANPDDFEILLKYLEYDFYIVKIAKTEKYVFASPMLRDYWARNQA
jgi:uncharacterized protein